MPRPACTSPRAPADAKGRTRSTATGSRPWSVRMRFTAAARSGAVSANVPSRSKSTARQEAARPLSAVTGAAQQVVDVAILLEPVDLGDGVVGHAEELLGAQPALPAPAREL